MRIVKVFMFYGNKVICISILKFVWGNRFGSTDIVNFPERLDNIGYALHICRIFGSSFALLYGESIKSMYILTVPTRKNLIDNENEPKMVAIKIRIYVTKIKEKQTQFYAKHLYSKYAECKNYGCFVLKGRIFYLQLGSLA